MFGMGCFWCSENLYMKMPGVHSTQVGYAGGDIPNPSYGDVCTGASGHNEVVRIVFDPKEISYVELLKVFWERHDPTTLNQQGNDRGTQYRSGFYYFDDEQKVLIENSKAAYEKLLGRPITTEVAAASDYDKYGGLWYYAEAYHQQYLATPGARPYCSAQPQGVSVPPYESWAPPELAHQAPKLPESFWKKHAPAAGCSVVNSPNEPIAAGAW